MARVFTINFEFQGADHAAVVSTWKEEAQWDCFQVALYDEELHHLAPDGIVRFSSREDGNLQTDTNGSELLVCLKKAVKGYLQKV